MAIKTVKVLIDGQTHTLTYNGSSGKYEATLTAPTITSFNKPDGHYPVTVEVTDMAGNITAQDSVNPANRLVVKEKVPPVISDVSPSAGARVTTAGPKITGKLTDELNGSGVDTKTFVLKVNGVPAEAAKVKFLAVAGGYTFEYQTSGLEQGNHNITIDVKDNDGNAAVQKTVTFTVDTIAPSLNVVSPAEGLMTNKASIEVSGKTSDATSSPVTVTVKVNGTDQGLVSVGTDGNFTKMIALKEGVNAVDITTRDSAGLSTTVLRSVTLDTVAPTINKIELVPNPVDAGATYIIKVTAAD